MNVETANYVLMAIKGIAYVLILVTFYICVASPFKKAIDEISKHTEDTSTQSPSSASFSEIKTSPSSMPMPSYSPQTSPESSESYNQQSLSSEMPFEPNMPTEQIVTSWADKDPKQAAQVVKGWMQEDLSSQ